MKEKAEMKVKRFLGICLDGYPFIALFIFATLVGHWIALYWLSVPLGILTLWCIWFFRDPDRHIPEGENRVVCPADGKIIKIEEAPCPYLLEGNALKISVFMNVFNVHVNRMPLTGKIVGKQYHPGKFLGAYHDKASTDNEQTGVVVETNAMQKVLFVQIAGLLARRVVCRAQEGETLERGSRYGLIRFGSRVDVYLPLNTNVLVSLGQKVSAGSTILAELR
jgi:phosphatidylserine decarboxylase